MSEEKMPAIHPTAWVEKTARLGAGTTIGPFAVVEEGAAIGTDCLIGAHAVIKGSVSIGNHNRICEGAVIGGDPQDIGFSGKGTRLVIGHDNIIREGVTIHRSTSDSKPTKIGDRNLIMCYAHVAHDCTLQNDVVVANNVCLAGHVDIEDHAFLSGGVVIHQFCRIGRQAMVGGNAKVIKDALPFFVVDGVPARTRGLNVVGLKRSDLPASELQALKESYRILFREPGLLSQKLAQLRRIESEIVSDLISFIRDSSRGFCPADTKGA